MDTLQDSATVRAARLELARRTGPVVEQLRRDPLGNYQTAADLTALAQVLSSERAVAGRASRSRLSMVLSSGGDFS